MMYELGLIVLILLATHPNVFSFTAVPSRKPARALASLSSLYLKSFRSSPLLLPPYQGTNGIKFSRATCFMSSHPSNKSEESQKRRRRKRKDGKNSGAVSDVTEKEKPSVDANSDIAADDSSGGGAERSISMTTTVDTNNPVQMQVMDIRDVVSGKGSGSNVELVTTPTNKMGRSQEEKVEEEYDDEYEYYYEDENNNEVIVGYSSSSSSSSLEQLLADAKKMRQDEGIEMSSVEQESSMTIRSVLSTIVTADFFVVCALLLWFLAGIFCSYVIKDDTVQIAFNGIFQPVVQPALGVLMIGSALSSVFDGSSDNDDETRG